MKRKLYRKRAWHWNHPPPASGIACGDQRARLVSDHPGEVTCARCLRIIEAEKAAEQRWREIVKEADKIKRRHEQTLLLPFPKPIEQQEYDAASRTLILPGVH